MVEEPTKRIRIDLDQFKLHLHLKPEFELTLHFDTPSRRFYLSVVGLVVHEMQKRGLIAPIALEPHMATLALLNKTIGGRAGSPQRELLLPRIYRKWKDALPDLENAPLFKVVGRKKRYDALNKIYAFDEEVKDSWANLFDYTGSHENVRLRFSIDRLGACLDDVVIVYGESHGTEAVDPWAGFIAHLGEKLEAESVLGPPHPGITSPDPSRKRRPVTLAGKWHWSALCALIAIGLAAVTFSIWISNLISPQLEVASVEKMAFPLPDKPSIAVLPFRNISIDPGQAYFCDGLTEEIVGGLSKFRSLFVIDHNATFTYKGQNATAQQVSEDLGVRYVLEGSVRKDENHLRITARLIDAIKGRHLWAEHYDRELKNIFSLQDEITLRILKSLTVQISEGKQERLIGRKTRSLQAYFRILEGAGYRHEFNFDASLRCFEEARQLDPLFAEAYGREALSHLRKYWFGPGLTRWQSFVRAAESAKKCAELDENLPVCNMALSIVHLVNGQWLDAVSEGKRAVELLPNSAEAATYFALVLEETGSYGKALGEIERALRLDPLNPQHAMTVLGVTYFNTGRIEDAIATCRKIVEIAPRYLPAHMVLALAYGVKGSRDQAQSAINSIREIRPGFSAKDFLTIFPRKTEKNIHAILDGIRMDGSTTPGAAGHHD